MTRRSGSGSRSTAGRTRCCTSSVATAAAGSVPGSATSRVPSSPMVPTLLRRWTRSQCFSTTRRNQLANAAGSRSCPRCWCASMKASCAASSARPASRSRVYAVANARSWNRVTRRAVASRSPAAARPTSSGSRSDRAWWVRARLIPEKDPSRPPEDTKSILRWPRTDSPPAPALLRLRRPQLSFPLRAGGRTPLLGPRVTVPQHGYVSVPTRHRAESQSRSRAVAGRDVTHPVDGREGDLFLTRRAAFPQRRVGIHADDCDGQVDPSASEPSPDVRRKLCHARPHRWGQAASRPAPAWRRAGRSVERATGLVQPLEGVLRRLVVRGVEGLLEEGDD